MKITNDDIQKFIPEGTQAGKYNPLAIVYSRMDLTIAVLDAMKYVVRQKMSDNKPLTIAIGDELVTR